MTPWCRAERTGCMAVGMPALLRKEGGKPPSVEEEIGG